jgi:hypothetical protein
MTPLLLTGAIFDVLSFGLGFTGLNGLVTVPALIMMGLVGAHTGMSIFSGSRAVGTALMGVGEAAPMVGGLPLYTIRAALIPPKHESEGGAVDET